MGNITIWAGMCKWFHGLFFKGCYPESVKKDCESCESMRGRDRNPRLPAAREWAEGKNALDEEAMGGKEL